MSRMLALHPGAAWIQPPHRSPAEPRPGSRQGHTDAERCFAATSIAVLRSLPPDHWLKGTP